MDFLQQLEKGRYGSFELKRQVGPNLLKGLLVSLIIHSTVIASPFIIAKLFVTNAVHGPGVNDRLIVLDKPVLVSDDPQTRTAIRIQPPSADAIKQKVWKPVEDKDLPADNPLPLDQDALKKAMSGAPLPDADDSAGGGQVVYRDPEPVEDPVSEHPIFIPYEVAPQPIAGCPQPEYPSLAQVAGTTGRVVVQVFVDKNGNVRKWEVVKADPKGFGFEEEVGKVVTKWKFTPAIQQGNPVGVWVAIPFNFKVKK